jgi:hypothetical protein
MDKAPEIPRWRESGAFTPLEREVLAYAEAMTVTEARVTDEMVASLRAQLGEAGRPRGAHGRDRVRQPHDALERRARHRVGRLRRGVWSQAAHAAHRRKVLK